MGNAFTHYWQNDTWDHSSESSSGQQLDHLAGNDFIRRGIKPGDTVYVVTNIAGEMYVAGRMIVDRFVSGREAERIVGYPVWEADEHLLGRDGTLLRFDRRVPDAVAKRLQFGNSGAGLIFDTNGKLDQQTLRGVRQLMPDSAELLDTVIAEPEPEILDFVQSADHIRENIGYFQANASEYFERAKKIVRQTSFWVYDPSTDAFGPGKFVGYRNMTFLRYERGREGETSGARFDGHNTKLAIENATGSAFTANNALNDRLATWIINNVGDGALGNAADSKWQFITLPRVAVDPFIPDHQYTRRDVYRILSVPSYEQDGKWDTGYTRHNGEWFIFCTVGGKGRTGHDYGNHWIGDDLFWRGKTGSKISHDSIKSLVGGAMPVHVFTREQDRAPFTFQGMAKAKETRDTVPVTVIWNFATSRPTIEPGEVRQPERYVEGATRLVSVNAYERNPSARRKCIEHYGTTCAICGMSFLERYGEIGVGFIHVHHLKPLAQVAEEYEVDPIKDLRPVCPNCHAMLHRTDPPLSIQELVGRLSRSPVQTT